MRNPHLDCVKLEKKSNFNAKSYVFLTLKR